jgi:hypothetical protein
MPALTVSPTHDYLLKDGKPFFYLADTVWAAFANLSIEAWRPYLAYRRAQGFTAVQISILPITHDTSTSPDSDQPFLPDAGGQWDVYRLNERYFDKAVHMVEMAVEAGILPVLGVVWKCHVPGTLASRRSPVSSTMPRDAMEAYAAYAVRRFAPYTPIFFISGDTAWDSDREPVYYMAALEIVRRLAPDALITMHMVPSATLPDAFAGKVDLYMYQSGHGPEQTTPYELALRHNGYAVRRPVVNGEPCYEGHGRGRTRTRFRAFDVRKATWQSLLSGAKMGVAYGAHGVWSCHREGMGFVQPQWKFVPYDWQEALRLPGAWDAALARWLFERYELYDVEPADLLAREDPEVRVARSDPKGLGRPLGSSDMIALYLPHAYDVALNVDLSGYCCELWDLERRRPMVPVVEVGMPSTVRASVCNGDVLILASSKGGSAAVHA